MPQLSSQSESAVNSIWHPSCVLRPAWKREQYSPARKATGHIVLDSRFVMAELENLLEHLGIADNYDLLGQSWGGMFGAMCGIKGLKGMKRLVISNSPASMKLWVEACNEWRKELPREVDEVLERCEKEKKYDDPEYVKAVMYFYKRHLCKVNKDGKPHGEGDDSFPKDVQDSLEWLEKDDTVYFTMNGPSEFTVVGSLKTWSVVDDLHKIEVPVLVLNGEFDEARDS